MCLRTQSRRGKEEEEEEEEEEEKKERMRGGYGVALAGGSRRPSRWY
jgi:hypothetical protein